MRVDVQADALPAVDASELVEDLASELGDHWAKLLLAGESADGSGPLPRSKQGEPLGRGAGTIARRWQTSKAAGDAGSASAETGPYQEGQYYWAVRRLAARGVDLVAAGPKAQELVDSVVTKHLSR